MITITLIILAWLILSVPIALGVGWLTRHGAPATRVVASESPAHRRLAPPARRHQSAA